jgi:hypothetical protein
MHFIRPFVLIGVGAFAAGIFYSKSSFDHGIDNWLVFAISLAIAFAGLFDSIALGAKSRRQPQWLKQSR